MADIELVVKISEDSYRATCNGYMLPSDVENVVQGIKNGKPLPKGHGRLKDIGKCNRKLFYEQCGGANSLITVKTAFDMLISLPTIIDADKAESEGLPIWLGKNCKDCGNEKCKKLGTLPKGYSCALWQPEK